MHPSRHHHLETCAHVRGHTPGKQYCRSNLVDRAKVNLLDPIGLISKYQARKRDYMEGLPGLTCSMIAMAFVPSLFQDFIGYSEEKSSFKFPVYTLGRISLE